jgi:hypothetical protein
MNPNGSWQSDAMDQMELANRSAAMQAAQMANEEAYRQLQAHLEQQKMAQQGSQFSQDLAARTGMHDEDLANARLMQSNAQDFSHNQFLQDLAARNHEADVRFGPDSLAAKQYADSQAFNNRILDMLGGGQSPAPQAAPAQATHPADVGVSMGGNMTGYGNGAMPAPRAAPAPAATQPSGGVDPAMLQKVALIAALRNGTPVPNFPMQNVQNQLAVDQLQQHEREIAGQKIQEALNNGDITTARQIAASSGAQMPRIDASSLMPDPISHLGGRPDVALKLSAIDTLAERATQAYNDKSSVDDLKAAMEDAATTLSNHGVNPDEARAVVNQRVLQKIPKKYGTMGGIASDIGYLMFQPEIFGQTSKSDRVNQIHDLIGQ